MASLPGSRPKNGAIRCARSPTAMRAPPISFGPAGFAGLHRAEVAGVSLGGPRPVHTALQRFKRGGRGVLVYLRDGTAGVPITAIPHEGDTVSAAARTRQWREIGVGAQILKDL